MAKDLIAEVFVKTKPFIKGYAGEKRDNLFTLAIQHCEKIADGAKYIIGYYYDNCTSRDRLNKVGYQFLQCRRLCEIVYVVNKETILRQKQESVEIDNSWLNRLFFYTAVINNEWDYGDYEDEFRSARPRIPSRNCKASQIFSLRVNKRTI